MHAYDSHAYGSEVFAIVEFAPGRARPGRATARPPDIARVLVAFESAAAARARADAAGIMDYEIGPITFDDGADPAAVRRGAPAGPTGPTGRPAHAVLTVVPGLVPDDLPLPWRGFRPDDDIIRTIGVPVGQPVERMAGALAGLPAGALFLEAHGESDVILMFAPPGPTRPEPAVRSDGSSS
jgi:hypothetical protein